MVTGYLQVCACGGGVLRDENKPVRQKGGICRPVDSGCTARSSRVRAASRQQGGSRTWRCDTAVLCVGEFMGPGRLSEQVTALELNTSNFHGRFCTNESDTAARFKLGREFMLTGENPDLMVLLH